MVAILPSPTSLYHIPRDVAPTVVVQTKPSSVLVAAVLFCPVRVLPQVRVKAPLQASLTGAEVQAMSKAKLPVAPLTPFTKI